MSMISHLRRLLKAWRLTRRQRRRARKTAFLKAEAQAAIQCCEFQGHIYLAYRGLPIVEATHLKGTLPQELEAARATYVAHYNTPDEEEEEV